MDKPKLKVVFAPGSMNSFEGTQEELDAFVAEITEMFSQGLPHDAIPVTPEEEEELIRLLQKQDRQQ